MGIQRGLCRDCDARQCDEADQEESLFEDEAKLQLEETDQASREVLKSSGVTAEQLEDLTTSVEKDFESAQKLVGSEVIRKGQLAQQMLDKAQEKHLGDFMRATKFNTTALSRSLERIIRSKTRLFEKDLAGVSAVVKGAQSESQKETERGLKGPEQAYVDLAHVISMAQYELGDLIGTANEIGSMTSTAASSFADRLKGKLGDFRNRLKNVEIGRASCRERV